MLLSVLDLMPFKILPEHVLYVRTKIFGDGVDDLTETNIVDKVNQHITSLLDRLTGVDLSDTSVENIKLFKDLCNAILVVSNLDNANDFNLIMRNVGKWLNFISVLGSGAEGTVYSVEIEFGEKKSPMFVMKTSRSTSDTYDESAILLKEFLNYSCVGTLYELTPNFIHSTALITCSSLKKLEYTNSSMVSYGFCNCVGTKNCTLKNYMFMIPFKGPTVQNMIKTDLVNVNKHLDSIVLQVTYSIKIAQDKMQFSHNDLNTRNVSVSIYPEMRSLTYNLNDTPKTLLTSAKVNIFDFGASEISKFDHILIKDQKLGEYYVTMFKTPNIYESMLKEIINPATDRRRRDALKVELLKVHELAPHHELTFTKQHIKDNRYTYSVFYGDSTIKAILGSETTLDTKSDIANFLNQILTEVRESIRAPGATVETKTAGKIIMCKLNVYKDELLMSATDLSHFIRLLDPIVGKSFTGGSITKYMSQSGGSDVDIDRAIQGVLAGFGLQNIGPIVDGSRNINVIGYDADKLYGPAPTFKLQMILASYDAYNLYGDINYRPCIDGSTRKMIHFGNPGYAKYFAPDGDIWFSNCKPSELILPTANGENVYYTYAFVVNKLTGRINVNYGRIVNLTEIGATHSIIANNNPVIVSGELSIKMTDGVIQYRININSSKMDHNKSKIALENNFNKNMMHSNNFYYVLMINLALKFFNAIDTVGVTLPNNYVISYDVLYEPRRTGDLLFDYYTQNPPACPTAEFISAYNQFGRDKKLSNACIGYSRDDGSVENIKLMTVGENTFRACEWEPEYIASGGSRRKMYKFNL